MDPTQPKGMPPLTQNIEGLRSHSLLVSIFVAPPEATPAQRRWRSWLVHSLTKAARHYENARKLTVMDARAANGTHPGGQALPMLDYAFELEDCITSLDKAIACIQALHAKGEFPDSRWRPWRRMRGCCERSATSKSTCTTTWPAERSPTARFWWP